MNVEDLIRSNMGEYKLYMDLRTRDSGCVVQSLGIGEYHIRVCSKRAYTIIELSYHKNQALAPKPFC